MSDGNIEKSNQGPNGRFIEGNKANPGGRNGMVKGWQPYGRRLQKWLDMPVAELLAMAQDEEGKKNLSTIDAICVQHVANALIGKMALPERREMLDRIEGTPKQTIEHQGSSDQPLYPTETKSVEDAGKAYMDAIGKS